GRAVGEQYPRVPHAAGEPVLELTDLCGDELPAGVSLTLHRGEILGVAGIIGSGRTEMLRAVYGLDPARRGSVKVHAVVNAAGPAAWTWAARRRVTGSSANSPRRARRCWWSAATCRNGSACATGSR